MKKVLLIAFALTNLLNVLFLVGCSLTDAEFDEEESGLNTLSIGIPLSHTFPNLIDSDENEWESDGVSGYFVSYKLTSDIGLGIDSFKTKIKHSSDISSNNQQPDKKLVTDIYNISYMLPIPDINLTVGLGMGTSKVECGGPCSENYIYNFGGQDYKIGYKKGSVSQWYVSVGYPISPSFDLHFSYRSISNKKIEQGYNKYKLDASGTVTGLGIAVGF